MNKREAKFNDYETPLITMVVNHRRESSILKACLFSILKQSYRNIEVVLYDYGTTDDSWQCAVSYQKEYPGVITLLRSRLDFLFDSFVVHYPNIRGRYFIAIDSAVVLNENAVSIAVKSIKNRNRSAFVLMGSEDLQERERFYEFNCEISGLEHLQSHLIAVPLPGSSIALYDTDIAKVDSDTHQPFVKQANLCFNYSAISISVPQFKYLANDAYEIIYPHILSLCNHKVKILRTVEKLYNFTGVQQMKDLCWERFAMELISLAKDEVEKESFESASRYFFLAIAQYPNLISQFWYNEVYDSIVNKRKSSFWERDFHTYYTPKRFQLKHNSMVSIDG